MSVRDDYLKSRFVSRYREIEDLLDLKKYKKARLKCRSLMKYMTKNIPDMSEDSKGIKIYSLSLSMDIDGMNKCLGNIPGSEDELREYMKLADQSIDKMHITEEHE